MVTSKQMIEKMRDYKRTFIRSWDLFKANRIGLLGLVILIAFTVMAAGAPFMGLKHPVEWTAPSSDLLQAEAYFVTPPNITGSVQYNIGTRIVSRDLGETNNADDHMDRIYVPVGDSVIAYSFNGYRRYAIDYNSNITTSVNVANLGGSAAPEQEYHVAYVGCADSTINAFVDDVYEREVGAAKNELPSQDEMFRYTLDGPVTTDVAVMNVIYRDPVTDAFSYTAMDRVFIGTSEGSVYSFHWNLALNWTASVGNETITSVAVTETLGLVLAGTSSGQVYAFRVVDGVQAWAAPYDSGSEISPIAIRNDGQVTYLGTSDGKLHAIATLYGTAMEGWEGGYALPKTLQELDGEQLQKPTMNQDGSMVYLTSESGYMYAVRTGNELNERLQWNFYAGGNMDDNAQFLAPPVFDHLTLGSIYGIADIYNGTPTNTEDDYSVLIRMSADGVPCFNMTFKGVAHVAPTLCYVRTHGFDRGIIAVSTDISADVTTMYSYKALGTYLAPLKPTWMCKSGTPGIGDDARDFKPPSGIQYWLGTDAQGRDILSQVIWGSQIALIVGFAAAAFSIGIGAIVGLVSGYYGGWVDAILMRFTDVILVLPSLPLLIIMAALLEPSIWNIVFIIGITGWGGPARMIRSQVLSLKERPFIDSARVTGASKMRIMFKHIAPNVLPLGLLYMTFYVGGAILSEASLAFIGLGDPRTMSWGMMLNFVQHSNALANWWWLIPPGLCITLVCMAFFLVGRAFDEIVNPRLRRR